MKFVLSYSCGKDSTLALHRMVKAGHKPVGLLVMFNEEMERSWFHGVDSSLLQNIAESLDIPLIPCICQGEDYHTALEKGLSKAKSLGAQACVFGDIDIQGHYDWCKDRCTAAGLGWEFPLWQQGREALVEEFLSLGYTALIKCVKNDLLPKSLLGKELSRETVRQMKQAGIDVCGENGEYHSVVIDGPLFHRPVTVEHRETLDFGTISAINLTATENAL